MLTFELVRFVLGLKVGSLKKVNLNLTYKVCLVLWSSDWRLEFRSMLLVVEVVTWSGELHRRMTHEAKFLAVGEVKVKAGLVEVLVPVCQLVFC